MYSSILVTTQKKTDCYRQIANDYKYNMIWLSHFNDSYEKGVRNILLDNRVDKDSEMLTKFELAKKVIKGECLINERNNQS